MPFGSVDFVRFPNALRMLENPCENRGFLFDHVWTTRGRRLDLACLRGENCGESAQPRRNRFHPI